MTIRRVTMVEGLGYTIENWPTAAAPFGWALVDQFYTPDEVVGQFMDAISLVEFVDSAYARQVASGLTTAITAPVDVELPGYFQFMCDDPDFGVMTDGNSAAGLILFGDTGVDATSPIIAVYPVTYTADGSSSLFTVSANGAVLVSTVCPSGF